MRGRAEGAGPGGAAGERCEGRPPGAGVRAAAVRGRSVPARPVCPGRSTLEALGQLPPSCSSGLVSSPE